MTQRRLQTSLAIMARSILAAVLTGASLAVLNIAVELPKPEPLLSLRHLFLVVSWHAVISLAPGILLGLGQVAYFLWRSRPFFKNGVLVFYSYLALAAWLLTAAWVNIRLLGSLLSLASVLGNAGLLLTGLAVFVILKRLDRTHSGLRPAGRLLMAYGAALVGITVFSYFLQAGVWAGRAGTSVAGMGPRKNVIVLILDSVRADHLSCYGYGKTTSPNIDRLASSGVLFERAFSCSSHTAEAVPSLLSSTYPSTHNVRLPTFGSGMTHLPRDLVILPTLLKSKGYRTAFFSVGVPISSVYGFDRDIDDYYEPAKSILNTTLLADVLGRVPWSVLTQRDVLGLTYSLVGTRHSLESTAPQAVIGKVISWLSRHPRGPFFAYVHLFGGHMPYEPPKDCEGMFGAGGPLEKARRHPERAELLYPFGKQEPLPPEVVSDMVGLYDAEIYDSDRSVAILIDYLKATGLIQDTIIILTADHGEEFYDHYGWGHIYSLFDELIRVPLILYGPGMIPEGKRVQELISQADLFPTILSLCGIGLAPVLPYRIEGRDFSGSMIAGRPWERRESVFAEVNATRELTAYALRTGRFKAIEVGSAGKSEKLFFDLAGDPRESLNLYSPANPEAEAAFSELEAVVSESKKKSLEARRVTLDRRTREQLKALGYIR